MGSLGFPAEPHARDLASLPGRDLCGAGLVWRGRGQLLPSFTAARPIHQVFRECPAGWTTVEFDLAGRDSNPHLPLANWWDSNPRTATPLREWQPPVSSNVAPIPPAHLAALPQFTTDYRPWCHARRRRISVNGEPAGKSQLSGNIGCDGHVRALYPAGVVTGVAVSFRPPCRLARLRVRRVRAYVFCEPISPQRRGISGGSWLAGSGHRWGRVQGSRLDPSARFRRAGSPASRVPVELVTLQAPERLDQQPLLTRVCEVSYPLRLSL